MNFEYSPGLFGYGIKGNDGSVGRPGANLFFTNYDRDLDVAALNACIVEDRVMWLDADPNIKLSNGRTYKWGDLFIDKDGWLSEINETENGYNRLNIRLNTLSLFEDANERTTNGFQRYQNIDDPSIKYIIDNIYSNSGVYPVLPTLYGINPKNYNRIEYSDVVDLLTSRNPFTVYSSGEIPAVDDVKALALVRDVTSNTFRLGNVGNGNNIRSTTLIFDVTSLRKNSSTFTINTPTQEIISNAEINANGLFSERENVFNYDPSFGLYAISTSTTTAEIIWDLSKITPDPCVYGELYFYDTSTSYVMFPIEASGTTSISGLTVDYEYDYYIKIIKDGWSRNTIIKTLKSNGAGTTYLTVTDPISLVLDASASGLIAGITPYSVDFNTNSITWNVYNTNNWISCVPISGSGTGDYSGTFNLTVLPNTVIAPRTGTIQIRSQAAPVTITVNQEGIPIPPANVTVQFNPDGRLGFTGLTPGIRVSVVIALMIRSELKSDNITIGPIVNEIRIEKDGAIMAILHDVNTAYPGQTFTTEKSYPGWPSYGFVVTGIEQNTSVEVKANGNCMYIDGGNYGSIYRYAKITSIQFERGSGTATIGFYNAWHSDSSSYGCDVFEQAYHE